MTCPYLVGGAAEPQPNVFCGSKFDVGALHASEAGLGGSSSYRLPPLLHTAIAQAL